MKTLLEILTEKRAKTVANGTKKTSGTALIILSCGTFSPALLAAMAIGGVTTPVSMVVSSILFSFTSSTMNFTNACFLASGLVSSHFLKNFCSLSI